MSKSKFLVSQMTKENKDRIKAKSIMLGKSIDDLILHAVNEYNPVRKCQCGKNATNTTVGNSIKIGDQEVTFVVEDFPTSTCEDCLVGKDKEVFINIHLLQLITNQVEENIIETKFKNKENNSSEFTFNFNELLKIK